MPPIRRVIRFAGRKKGVSAAPFHTFPRLLFPSFLSNLKFIENISSTVLLTMGCAAFWYGDTPLKYLYQLTELNLFQPVADGGGNLGVNCNKLALCAGGFVPVTSYEDSLKCSYSSDHE